MQNLSKLIALLMVFVLASCTNDSEPASDPQLVVTSSVADSVVNPALPITFDLLVRSNNQPVQGATVIVTKPNGVNDTLATKTGADGTVIFTEQEFSGAYNQWNIYSFRAIKDGSKTSTRFVRHVRVFQPLQISVADTTTVMSGSTALVTLTVKRFPDIPLEAAILRIDNEAGDMVTTQATDGAGQVLFSMPTDGVFTGLRRFTAVATKDGFAVSAPKTFFINVTKFSADPVVQLYFNSLGKNKIGVQWDPNPDVKELLINALEPGSDFPIATARVSGSNRAVFEGPGIEGVTEFTIAVNGNPIKPERFRWFPAKRLPLETSGQQTIRLWETANPSSTDKSGLIVRPDGLTTAHPISPDSAQIDLVLATMTEFGTEIPVALVSPGVEGSGIIGGRRSMFAYIAWDLLGGIDEDYYQTTLEGMVPTGPDAINTVMIARRTEPNPNMSLVIPAIFEGGHYGRIEVKPQPDGQLFGKQGDYHFVDLVISYQEIVNEPYAARPRAKAPYKHRRVAQIKRK